MPGGGVSLLIRKASPFQLFLSPDNYLWFLWDLFFISLIFNGILFLAGKDEKPTKAFAILAVITIIILGAGKFIPTNDYNIKSICWMFQFYVAGAAYRVYGERIKSNRSIGIIMAILFFVVFWSKYTIMPQDGLITYVVMTIIAYMGCSACFLLFKSYAHSNTPLTLLGQSTLGVYAVHQGLITFLSLDNVWLSFVIVLLLSVAIVYFIRWSNYFKFLIGE